MQCLEKPASESLESGYHPGDLDYRFDVVVVVQGIFAKIGPDLELRGGDLISSPVDSIVSLVSPKKVADPTLWGKIIFRPRPFSLLAKIHPVAIMPNMAL